MFSVRLWFAVAVACLVAPAGMGIAAEAPAVEAPAVIDPRVKPGATFEIEFPDLPNTRTGKVSSIRVTIPSGYTPEKFFPLIAWMGGGDGGANPASAAALVDTAKFICVGLPFPMGCNNPRQANMVGNFPAMWEYHRTMLAELERVVPNISQRLRVVAGFSNGAHTIAGYMAMAEPNLLPGFTTYILAEGGEQGDYRHLAGRHVCVTWGEAGQSNRLNSLQLAAAAEAAQMKVLRVPQPGIGHAFDTIGKTAAREWLAGTVIDSLVAEAAATLEKGGAGSYAAGKQLEVLVAGTGAEKEFQKSLAEAEAAAVDEFRELEARMAGEPAKGAQTAAVKSLRTFVRNYAGSEQAKAAQAMIDQIAQQELDALLESLPADPNPPQRKAAAVKLQKFATTWAESSAATAVRQTLDAYSDRAWEELRLSPPERPTPQHVTALAAKCRKFCVEWPETTGARAALAVLDTLGQAELDSQLTRIPEAATPDQKRTAAQHLRTLQKRWEGTPAAGRFAAAITRLEQP